MPVNRSVDIPQVLNAAVEMALGITPNDPDVVRVAQALVGSKDPETQAILAKTALQVFTKHRSAFEKLAAKGPNAEAVELSAREADQRKRRVDGAARAARLASRG